MPLMTGSNSQLGSVILSAAAASAASAASLTDLVTIWRKTVVSDGAAGFTETWAAVGNVFCSLVKVTKWVESSQGGELKSVTTWEGEFPVGSDLYAADRIVKAASSTNLREETFEVTGTDSGKSNASLLMVMLVKLT